MQVTQLHLKNKSQAYSSFEKRQRGISSINLLVYICFGAALLIGVLKVLPAYIENSKIQTVITGVAEGFSSDGGKLDKTEFKNKIVKRFRIENISAIRVDDIEFLREDKIWTVDAGYEKRVELFSNIALMIDFTESNKFQIGAK